MSDEMIICPHCGEENLPQATRCVHCGLPLEGLFQIEGLDEHSTESSTFQDDDRDDLPKILQDLRREEEKRNSPEEPDLAAPSENEVSGELLANAAEGQTGEASEGNGEAPEWLQHIRQRAKEEQDASGDFVKKINAMDETLHANAQSQVDEEFGAWITRIRERTRRENIQPARLADESSEPEGSVPEWLQRVRDLQSPVEDETTKEVPAGKVEDEPFDQAYRLSDWEKEDLTETELAEIKQKLTGGKEPTEPVETPPVAELPEIEPADEITPSIIVPEEALPTGQDISPVFEEHEIAGEGEIFPSKEEAQINQTDGRAENAKSFADVGEKQTVQPNAERGIAEPPSSQAELQEEPLESILAGAGMAVEALDLSVAEEKPVPTGDKEADLLLLRSQRERAKMLKTLIGEEGQPPPPLKTQRTAKSGWKRFSLAMLLLIALIATIIIAPDTAPGTARLSAPALAFQDHLEAMNPDDRVLAVIDYQAATSPELEQMAAPVLQKLEEDHIQWQPVTTQPNGLWLAQQLFEKAGLLDTPEVAYIPGGKLGLFALALGNENPEGMEIYPDLLSGQVNKLQDFTYVLLLSDSGYDVQGWMEQVAPWTEGTKFLVLSSNQEAATLLPYYDSGQIAGCLAGVQEARLLQSQTGTTLAGGTPIRAYEAGMLVMAVLLILGMISKAEMDSSAKPQKDQEQ